MSGLLNAQAARPLSDEEMAKMRANMEYEEAKHRARYQANDKLNPVMGVIQQSGSAEDILRAAQLLKPLAIEILGR